MRKINYLLGLGAVAVAILFNACEGEVLPAPKITYDQASPVVLDAGVSSVTLTGTIVAEAKLKQVTIHAITGLSEQLLTTITDFESGAITTTDDLNYAFRITIDNLSEETTIKITALDKDDQESSQSVVVQVTAGGDPISSFTAILMGAQSNTSEGSYLDAVDGDVYLQAGAEANSNLIDIVYYYGSTNEATLTSPDDATVNGGAGNLSLCVGFTTKNSTKFGSSSLSAADFDAVSNSSSLADISGLSATKMTQLSQGDVIEFITDDGKKGLAKVASITTGASGSITIDVKVEL